MALSVALATLLAADLYAHHRAASSAGLNRWGYRGPVVSRKQPGEIRVAVLGGSTVFGYGVYWHEAFPPLLERELQQHRPQQRFTVVNLGYNNEGAYALEPTLQDFAYLDYDIVVIYAGYNDLLGDIQVNWQVYRHSSPVFRLTGYFPILPLVLEEKAAVLRSGGGKTVFTPGVMARTSAAALETAAAIGETMATQLDRVAGVPPAARPAAEGCAPPWRHYCDSLARAIRYARQHGKKVVVASPPTIQRRMRERHESQHRAAAEMVARTFGDDPSIRWIDLSQAINLLDPQLTFDEMHLRVEGNAVIAKALVAPVMALAGS